MDDLKGGRRTSRGYQMREEVSLSGKNQDNGVVGLLLGVWAAQVGVICILNVARK